MTLDERVDRLEEALDFDLPFMYQKLAARVRVLEDRFVPVYDNELKGFKKHDHIR